MIAQKNQRLVIQGAPHANSNASSASTSTSTRSTSATSASSSTKPAKQTQPPVNSSFDDLVEAGLPDSSPRPQHRTRIAVVPPAQRRPGLQSHIPGRHPGPPGSTQIGFQQPPQQSDSEDLSEPELPPNPRVNLNPSANANAKSKNNGKRVGVTISRSSKSEDSSNDDDCDFDEQLKPLSARRKGSIAPIRITNSNFNKLPSPTSPTKSNSNGNGGSPDFSDDFEKGSSASPTPSATSISSLIREKLGKVPIPGVFRNKKPKEYKLQAFVIILFLTIIVIVGSIYIIHKEKELQKSYFDRIRFSSKDRRIRITNIQDRIVLSGTLGFNLTPKDKAWPCLPQHQLVNSTCLEWMGKGRLYLQTKAPPPRGGLVGVTPLQKNNILCYVIYWEALSEDFTLKDCFDMGTLQRGGYFYGGGEMEGENWPLNKSFIEFSPFLTGRKSARGQWGHSLRRYFVNSEGAAIKITGDSPLFVSINDPEGKICFGGKTDSFSFPSRKSEKLPYLNYTICTAENSLEISKRLGDKSIYENLRHEDVQLTYSVTDSAIYKISKELIDQGNLSEVALLNYTDKIASSKLPTNGFILLDESWQEKIGDLEADPGRFPHLGETLNITKRRGFRIAFTIQPFFSTESSNYVEGLKEGIWLKEKGRETPFGGASQNTPPALTEYHNWNSVAVLDVTLEKSRKWLKSKVKLMAEKYGIEALYADMGTCFDLPQYYQYGGEGDLIKSCDEVKDLFLQTLRSIPHLSTIGVSTAVKLPKPPTFVNLSPTESSWKGLKSLIPNMLSLGLAGFPFLNPGSIGGDFKFPVKKSTFEIPTNFSSSEEEADDFDSSQNETISTSTTSTSTPEPSQGPAFGFTLPERELYIRWLQLAHFLPVVQYSSLPNDYDDEVVKIAQFLENERKQKIFNYLKKAMNDLITGLPIIRPLWMIDPADPNCLKIDDEFALAEDIIVAPILTRNSTERDIYLPKGICKDELEQSSTKSGRWLHNYKVKIDQIPYFVKLS